MSRPVKENSVRYSSVDTLFLALLLVPFNLSCAERVYELLSIISNARVPRTWRLFCRHSRIFFFSFFLFSFPPAFARRITRERSEIPRNFFCRARFLRDGDLMELKSFRDAHRCALYSHAARGTWHKNSLRAKKESPDRWSTIWEINYRARRNLAEIISHGSAVVIAVVALKRLLRALDARPSLRL